MLHISFFKSLLLAAFMIAISAVAVSAQQNLFNVPSGIITQRGALFFQQQFNIGKLTGTSNTSMAVGLGDGWEAGFNLLDLYMYDHSTAQHESLPTASVQGNPDLMMNVQKGFQVTDFWRTGFGTQAGFNPARTQANIQFQNFSWWVNSFEIRGHEEFGKWYLGADYANHAYAGGGNRVGGMIGCEVPIVKEKLSFQADALLGNNDLSVAVIGGVYTFENHWQLSLGAQVPIAGSGNTQGLVIEFTYPGLNLFKKQKRPPGSNR